MADPATRMVQFADNSIGDVVKYVWSFGDDSTSTEQNPVHTYKKAGFYNVCLTVENRKGISNISCYTVAVATQIASSIKADFIYVVNDTTKTVSFTDASQGTIATYLWNFGDGDTSSLTNPKHIYKKAGYYLVSLIVKNAQGKQNKDYKLINVAKPNAFMISFGYDSRGFDRKAGGYPIDLVGAGLGDQSKLRWSFGDGTIDTINTSPMHVFASPKTYQVCLTVSDPVTGAEAMHCDSVTVEELCKADVYQPVAKCKSAVIQMGITGLATITTAELDNASSDDCGIKEYYIDKSVFETAGDYSVQFIVKDYKGNSDTCYAKVTVEAGSYVGPMALVSSFTAYPNPFAASLKVSYFLTRASNIELSLFDLTGKRVTNITSGANAAGSQTIDFDGSALQSGSYIIQLKSAEGVARKQIVIKR